MSVLYLLSSGIKARKSGPRVLVELRDHSTRSVMLKDIDQVVVGEKAQITTQLVCEFVRRKVTVTYMGTSGEVLGTLGDGQVTLARLKSQMEYFSRPDVCLALARNVVETKLRHQMELLRQYAGRRRNDPLKKLAADIEVYIPYLEDAHNMETVMGIEGYAARLYFSGIPNIIDKERWNWTARSRRPPRDPVNALLSFGYTLVEKDVRYGIAGAKLDPRIGFLHSNDGRKDSLVYDMLEMFRQPVVDKLVFRLLNNKVFLPEDFDISEEGCFLKHEALKVWITRYEEYMQKEVAAFDGQTPRIWICNRIADVARMAYYV